MPWQHELYVEVVHSDAAVSFVSVVLILVVITSLRLAMFLLFTNVSLIGCIIVFREMGGRL